MILVWNNRKGKGRGRGGFIKKKKTVHQKCAADLGHVEPGGWVQIGALWGWGGKRLCTNVHYAADLGQAGPGEWVDRGGWAVCGSRTGAILGWVRTCCSGEGTRPFTGG